MEILPDYTQIKNLRKSLNISQKELGEKLQLSQSTISRIENGTMDPPYSKFKLIYEFLENEKRSRKKSKKHALDILTPDIIFINPNSTVKEAVEFPYLSPQGVHRGFEGVCNMVGKMRLH